MKPISSLAALDCFALAALGLRNDGFLRHCEARSAEAIQHVEGAI